MNKNFIFFVIACALLFLSIIAANVAPIISKASTRYFEDWGISNCQKKNDDYKHAKDNHVYDDDITKPHEELAKRIIKECKNHNTMYSLEYVALIVDVSLGFICTVLGLIYYLEPGKPLEKQSGLIGLIAGVITTVLTVVYVAFSAMIFSNDPVNREDNYDNYYKILYPNKASVKYNGAKYIFDYDKEKAEKEDLDIPYIKYKDLGKKQYNYDSEIYQSSKDSDSEYFNCRVDIYHTDFDTFPSPKKYTVTTTDDHECKYLWHTSVQNKFTDNKYLYDRWLTCIIFCALIAVC